MAAEQPCALSEIAMYVPLSALWDQSSPPCVVLPVVALMIAAFVGLALFVSIFIAQEMFASKQPKLFSLFLSIIFARIITVISIAANPRITRFAWASSIFLFFVASAIGLDLQLRFMLKSLRIKSLAELWGSRIRANLFLIVLVSTMLLTTITGFGFALGEYQGNFSVEIVMWRIHCASFSVFLVLYNWLFTILERRYTDDLRRTIATNHVMAPDAKAILAKLAGRTALSQVNRYLVPVLYLCLATFLPMYSYVIVFLMSMTVIAIFNLARLLTPVSRLRVYRQQMQCIFRPRLGSTLPHEDPVDRMPLETVFSVEHNVREEGRKSHRIAHHQDRFLKRFKSGQPGSTPRLVTVAQSLVADGSADIDNGEMQGAASLNSSDTAPQHTTSAIFARLRSDAALSSAVVSVQSSTDAVMTRQRSDAADGAQVSLAS